MKELVPIQGNYSIFIFFISDVNECEDNTNECDVNANCTDLEGSYTCTCQMGYYSEEGGNGRNGTCKGKLHHFHLYKSRPQNSGLFTD